MGVDKYIKVELGVGSTIDEALEKVKSVSKAMGCKAYGKFNGEKIFSVDTLDLAYSKITGKTKSENDEEMKKWKEDRERDEKEHKDKIPELTAQYIQKAEGIIRNDKIDKWIECVPIRLNDLYRGMELQSTLDLATILKTGDFEKADEVFTDQGHSGMSHSLVCCMLSEFSENGSEFVKRYDVHSIPQEEASNE